MTYFLSVFRLRFVRALCNFSVLLFEIIFSPCFAVLVLIFFYLLAACCLSPPCLFVVCRFAVRIFIAPFVFGEK